MKPKDKNDNDKMTIKTGTAKYSFSQDWLENDGLRDILTGLVADDLNRNRDAH